MTTTARRSARRGGSGANASRSKGLIHRYELFNRRETFAWVAEDGSRRWPPAISHRPEDPVGLEDPPPLQKEADAVLDCLRSPSRVCLTPFAADDRLAVPIAA